MQQERVVRTANNVSHVENEMAHKYKLSRGLGAGGCGGASAGFIGILLVMKAY